MFCKQCGKELEEDALFCPECGTEVKKGSEETEDISRNSEEIKSEESENVPGPAENDKEIRSKRIKLSVLIGCVIIVLVVIGIAVIFNSHNKKTEIDDGNGNSEKQEVSEEKEKNDDVNEDEFIFPHSDTEYLTDADVEPLTEEELGYARNEIMARRGRIYKGGQYEVYFSDKSWYKGTIEAETFDANYENELNEIEKANVELIKKYEKEIQNNRLANQYYASILTEYQKAEAEGFSSGVDSYPNVNPLLFVGTVSDEPLYYTLIDLCGDGIPELFIAQLTEDEIGYNLLELYGYQGVMAQQLSLALGWGTTPLGERNVIGERTRYYICENNMIKEFGSGGAGTYGTTYYQLNVDSAEVIYVESANRDYDNYYGSDDGFSTYPLTEEEFESVSNKYSVKTDLEWQKLADFKVDTGDAADSEIKEKYAEIIQQYRDNMGVAETGGVFDFDVKYPNVNRNVFNTDMNYMSEWTSYTLIDIDGNGTEELIIADVPVNKPDAYVIYDAYTYVNGVPKRLFDDDMGDQKLYYICEDGYILKVESQQDSSWYGNHFYQLKEDVLEYADGVWIYSNSSTGAMYSKGEEWLSDNAEDVDKNYYDSLMKKHPLKTDINWNYI